MTSGTPTKRNSLSNRSGVSFEMCSRATPGLGGLSALGDKGGDAAGG